MMGGSDHETSIARGIQFASMMTDLPEMLTFENTKRLQLILHHLGTTSNLVKCGRRDLIPGSQLGGLTS